MNDNNDKKQVEAALRESENRFQKIVEQAPIAMAIVNLDGVIEYINQKAVADFGYLPEEIPTMERWWAQAYPDEAYRQYVIADWMGRIQKAMAEGTEIIGNEYRVTCKNGMVKTMVISGALVSGKVFVLFDDFTERKQMEESLRKSEERYRCLVETTDTGYVILDIGGCVIDANPEYVRLTGYAALPEILGKNVLDWTAPEDREINAEAVATCIGSGVIRNFVISYIDKAGKRTPVEINASMMTKDGEQIILSLCRDITQRRKAEAVQKQTSSLLRATLESTADGILVIDLTGKVMSFNNKFGELWRIPRALLQTSDDSQLLVFILNQLKDPDQFIGKVKALYAQPRLASFDVIEFKDGRFFERYSQPQSIDDKIVGRVWSFRDITERKKTELLLTNAQKLESLGVLAGGIAHDFNNLLGGIFGYIGLAHNMSHDEKVTDYLSKALNTLDRARGLTQQLLTFAKGGEPDRKIGPLMPFLKETVEFALSGSSVSCGFGIPENLWACNFDKGQIGQVIDNIVINAQQAMPMGGTLEIVARNENIDAETHPTLSRGQYVKISIMDSGVGIAAEILPRIFDPFFTTKTKGHGLGLAVCYSTVKRHGGTIEVDSEPGKGTAFHLYLPASPGTTIPVGKKTADRHRGTGGILVLDDEDFIRETLGDTLQSFGYSVVLMKDGNAAVEYFRQEYEANRSLAAVFLDLTIPGSIGGKEVVQKIRQLNKAIPIFVSSGYSDDPIMTNPTEYGFTASLPKPCRTVDLEAMLNRYLKNRS